MQTVGIGKLFAFLLGLCINKHFKEIINFCLFQQFPDSASDNKPAELSGYRIIDLGFFQQSLKSCQHCKSGKMCLHALYNNF